MPFGNTAVPGLGINLLRGCLAREGFTCEIRYLQLPFAAAIGETLYKQISHCYSSLILGEWIFAHHLSDDDLPSADEYFDIILRDYVARHGRELSEDFIAQLPSVRERTSSYLDECMQSINWDQYSIIGFSCTFAQNMASLALAKKIKEAHPQITIVFGGANADGDMGIELHRQYPFVDYVCSGESDWLFPEFVKRFANDEDVTDLPGLIYRKDGVTISNGEQAIPFQNLDDLPIPDYDDYFEQLMNSGLEYDRTGMTLVLETSRGCWWGAKSKCSFCGIYTKSLEYRCKSADRVIDEFVKISQRYPDIKRITLADNILDVRFFKDVIPMLIERDLGLSFFYEVKANLTKKQLTLLNQAGVHAIQPGIESLDTEILTLMRKGCTTIQNVQLLKWAYENGIYVDWNLLVGFPGEDPAAYARMLDLIPSLSHLQPPTSKGTSRLTLLRFSVYYDDPSSYGIENVRPVEAYRFVYPFSEDVLSRLAYNFDFDYADGRKPEEYTRGLNQAIELWHEHNNIGTLMSMHKGEQLMIYDSRPVARQREVALEGVEKEIYTFCDEGKPLAIIMRHLDEIGETQDEDFVVRLLNEWIEARVMLHVDDRYLSLAISLDEQAHQYLDKFVNVLIGS